MEPIHESMLRVSERGLHSLVVGAEVVFFGG